MATRVADTGAEHEFNTTRILRTVSQSVSYFTDPPLSGSPTADGGMAGTICYTQGEGKLPTRVPGVQHESRRFLR